MSWDRMQVRFHEMKAYIGWNDEDSRRVVELWPIVSAHVSTVVEDFYVTVLDHPEAARVLTGGAQQITRLKETLRQWLEELLAGTYDDSYFCLRWQVGYRHVEIGLDQLYTNMAFARLRDQLTGILVRDWQGSSIAMAASIRSLNKLLDLDLAIVQEAYTQEHLQRELELERKQVNEKLLQAHRLATIGEMNTRLAHESRNALQRLRVCTEMLEYEVGDNTEAIRLIARAQKAQDDLQRLFDEVRNFASPINLEITPCRLPSLWHEAWDLLHWQRTDRQAELVEDSHGSELHVKVDRFRLVQLFRNLFENSLAACTDPVCIHIESYDNPLESAEFIEIHILDNGPGLDEEARRLAFQPFFTTKTKGTGLGLAIARRIMDAHGGTIEVLDRSQRGAEIVLRLPRMPPD